MADRSRLRLFILRVLVVSLLATLFGRLWYLQVMAGDTYAQAAADNRLRDIVTPATRGQILDDAGRPLVTNKTALVVSVDRVALEKQADGGEAVLHRLGGIIGMPYQELRDKIRLCSAHVPPPCWSGSPYQPIPVSDHVDVRQALQIVERQEDFPGVSAEVQAVRAYPRPDGALASHLLGYLGPITDEELKKLPANQQAQRRNTLVGRAGLERVYEQALRGDPGIRTVSVDHLGAVTGVIKETPPTAGQTLVTSLDAKVQHVLEGALQHGIQIARQNGDPGDSAAGVVLDAQTGHVVAMASYPTYQPDVFVGGISQKDYSRLTDPKNGNPLLDRAVLGQYAPGSTFKLISTAGLVHDGIADLNGRYLCSGSYDIGGRTFHNFEGEAFGFIDLHTTIVKSCDTVYYRLAYQDWRRDQSLVAQHKKPVEGVQHMARAFGLGSPTGVDLPAESAGLIEDRATKLKEWQDFYRPNACKGAKNPKFDPQRRAFDEDVCKYGYIFNPGDQANFDIGQGTVLVTPLQLATAYAALVNGGKVYSPRIGKALVTADGQLVRRVDAPVRNRLPVSPKVLDYIEQAMYDVPKIGTASGAFAGFPFDQVAVGGKTGTAEVSDNKKDTAWFAAFAGRPGKPPQYVAVVMVTQGGQGGIAAAPAVRDIWDGIYGLDGHPPALHDGAVPATLPGVAPAGATTAPGRKP